MPTLPGSRCPGLAAGGSSTHFKHWSYSSGIIGCIVVVSEHASSPFCVWSNPYVHKIGDGGNWAKKETGLRQASVHTFVLLPNPLAPSTGQAGLGLRFRTATGFIPTSPGAIHWWSPRFALASDSPISPCFPGAQRKWNSETPRFHLHPVAHPCHLPRGSCCRLPRASSNPGCVTGCPLDLLLGVGGLSLTQSYVLCTFALYTQGYVRVTVQTADP